MGHRKEHLEELTIRDLRWIISDLDRFSMTGVPCADLLITRCSSGPSGISRSHINDAFNVFEDGVHSPKAPSCKHGGLLSSSACEGRVQSCIWNGLAGSSDCMASQRSANKENGRTQ